jgi:purine-binding chemotaxis protein CheW
MSILVFNAGTNGRFGLKLLSVSEIIKRQTVQRFPGMNAFISGVLDIRGRVVTVIDLPRLLLGAHVDLAHANLVVLDKGEGDYALKVSGVDRIIKETDGLKRHNNRMKKYTGEVLILEDNSLVQMIDLESVLSTTLSGQSLR